MAPAQPLGEEEPPLRLGRAARASLWGLDDAPRPRGLPGPTLWEELEPPPGERARAALREGGPLHSARGARAPAAPPLWEEAAPLRSARSGRSFGESTWEESALPSVTSRRSSLSSGGAISSHAAAPKRLLADEAVRDQHAQAPDMITL